MSIKSPRSAMLSCELFSCSLSACVPFIWILVWLGSLAAVSIELGHPGPLFAIGCLGIGDGALPLFLAPTNSNSSALRVACEMSALRTCAVAANSSIHLELISSLYFWKVQHSLFCHAQCSLPQFTHDTLSFMHSFVWCGPAHSPHCACFPHADCVWPHCWQLKHCLT